MGKDDPGAFSGWLGRKTEAEDLVTDRLVASFRATLEPHLAAVPAGTAPLGLHWCLSPRIAPMAELGPDGHPAKNRDLPPVPQPRRMWAGGEIEARDPLRVGDRVHLTSTITNVVRKQGRSGELWFVTVRHDYATERGLAIRDRHRRRYSGCVDLGPCHPSVLLGMRPESTSLRVARIVGNPAHRNCRPQIRSKSDVSIQASPFSLPTGRLYSALSVLPRVPT